MQIKVSLTTTIDVIMYANYGCIWCLIVVCIPTCGQWMIIDLLMPPLYYSHPMASILVLYAFSATFYYQLSKLYARHDCIIIIMC